MSYVNSSRLRNESMCYRSNLHWIVVAGPAGTMAMAGVVLELLYSAGELPAPAMLAFSAMLDWTPQNAGATPGTAMLAVAAVLAAAAGGIAVIRAMIRRATTEYVVTNRRVVAKWGFISRDTYEISIDRIEGAHVGQGAMGRMLGYGTVFIRGTGGGVAAFTLAADPVGFRVAVAEAVDQRQDERDANTGHRREDGD